ncbi:MAG: 3'-5' exonuclease [Candidatus Nomurabacteria bacterium]|nr:MAG: 3'-5' exonuclease [Candidatus Nomurabacteria bacterium]
MKKHNLAFIDTETTGLDFDKHELIEIGIVLAKQSWDGDDIKLEVLEEVEIKIKPERIQDADPQSLRINGYNEADWLFAHDLETAMKIFVDKTKDAIMVTHNLSFDAAFIDKAFKKTGITSLMHYPRIDSISVAFAKLHHKDDLRYSLRSLCEHYGINNKKAHTALSDARVLAELYEKIINEKKQ